SRRLGLARAARSRRRSCRSFRSDPGRVELREREVGAGGLSAAGGDELSREGTVEPLRRLARVQPAAAVFVLRALSACRMPRPPRMPSAAAPAAVLTPYEMARSTTVIATAVSAVAPHNI